MGQPPASPPDLQRVRAAMPDHFFRAIEHGLAVVAAGANPAVCQALARGAAARGLTDASEGFMHAYLRALQALSTLPVEHATTHTDKAIGHQES